jgi:hypothetical protein
VAQEGATPMVVKVETWVLPAGAGVEVGGKPIAAVDADADAGEAGRWGYDGTPSGASGEHYRTELAYPFSSLPPCGHESHHP